MKTLLTTTFIMFNAYLGFSQAFEGNPKDINQILENTKKFSEYVMSSNYDGIAASYTDNAKIFPNNTLILEGKDIIKYWTLPDGISTPYHKITQSEITVVGNTAYDYGYYEGKTKRKEGQISSWKGKYVIVWKKVDGDWKMYLDIWNGVK
nr:nuclear transport factor 2 family protein [uncultured Allomuricauda sp.]